MMNHRHLTTFEHQVLEVSETGGGLSLLEADRLMSLGELRPGFCARGHRVVRLSQFCGVLSLGARVLEILPKVEARAPPEDGRALLLRLLRHAESTPFYQHLNVGQSTLRAPLLELFISAFFDSVLTIVHGGLLREYRVVENDVRVVRGRIVTQRQFATHANRADLLACRYDELTADNSWNRALKSGLRAVRHWIASPALQRRCIELLAVFAEVEDVEVRADHLEELVFDRKSTRYRTAIEWVRRILAVLSPALRAGPSAAPSMLFDMNLLFQSAVAARLRRNLHDTKTELVPQLAGEFLATLAADTTRRAFALRPDLVLRSGSEIVAVADTKWKLLGVDRAGRLQPDSADIYQMLAYAAALRCEHLALIYPWHDGLQGTLETEYRLPSLGELRPTLSLVCVDLRDDRLCARRGHGAPGFGRLLPTPA